MFLADVLDTVGRDREIEVLKKDKEMLKEYPVRSTSALLFLPNNLAMEVYDAVRDNVSSSSSSDIAVTFNLEHNGEEVTAVYRLDLSGSNSIGKESA